MRLNNFGMVALLALTACTGDAKGPGSGTEGPTSAYDGIEQAEKLSLGGTEPFWSATISGETLVWTTPEISEGLTIPVKRFAGNNGLGFSGDLDGKFIQIAVTPGECSDGMSDRTYPFTVTMMLGDQQLQGCGYSDVQLFEGEETP